MISPQTHYNIKEKSHQKTDSTSFLSPELMELLASSAKLKGKLSNTIEEENFTQFKETFEIYYKKSYSKEIFNFTPSLNSLKILFDYIESDSKNTAIDFFEKANLVTPEAILMTLFTQGCNTELSKRFKDSPCTKHEEYWARGIEISPKYFDTFCEYFNKDEFLKEKNTFIETQNKFIVNHKLNSQLSEKKTSLLKVKI